MSLSSSEQNGGENSANEFKSGASSGAPTILLVERNQSTRDVIQHTLRSQYQIDAVTAYEEARHLAESEEYDGILLSVYHQALEQGVEMVNQLRLPDACADVPIIILARPLMEGGWDKLFDDGVDDVVQMPFSKSDLFEVLGRHLSDEGGNG